ncbi:hypothetical protein BGZ70_007740 [Mortierella alpina]|uniref:Uncharacterized protein n=1 Tax=Mortierella alpina TaxID=64518 RepID=A0A9P6M2C5_MORAP|nr:hypothetical protein BGZ70_007740 [Mortierella alpina]
MVTSGLTRCEPIRSIPSFLYTTIPIAPLNIASRTFSQMDTPSARSPLSAHAQKTFSAQSMLESNVRFLCDMVDNVLRTSTELEHTTAPLRIQIQASGPTGISSPIEQCPKSPLFLLSPRTFTQAKSDLSMVDGGVVSKFNRDTLLNLFPTPPKALPCHQSARVAAPPRVSLDCPIRALENAQAVKALSPCEALSPREPFSAPKPLVARRAALANVQPSSASSPALLITSHLEVNQDKDFLSPLSAVSSTSSSPSSPIGHMDALSQHLWNIETQMRRPSFLMNRRTSSLSALFVSNAVAPSTPTVATKQQEQERLLAELSLTVGTIATPTIETPVILCESNHVADQDVDWRAWHGAWTRRRITPEDETLLSPTRSDSRTSCSSSASDHSNNSFVTAPSTPICHTPVVPTCRKSRKPRIFHPSFSFSSSSSSLSSSAISSSNIGSSNKDRHPDLSATESQKWGDRFQTLVHNFQASAGKHSRRLADILPKNRWTKRSRSRSSSDANKAHA